MPEHRPISPISIRSPDAHIAPKVLPDSKRGDAVSDTLNQWEGNPSVFNGAQQ